MPGGMSSKYGDDKMGTDVFTSEPLQRGSAAEKYFEYMLLKEKLSMTGSEAEQKAILGATSEKDAIKVKVLKKIIHLPESSPEFSQLVSITGTEDKFQQAEWIADRVYDKVVAKNVLAFYAPDDSVFDEAWTKNSRNAIKGRLETLAKGPTGTSESSLETFFAGLGFFRPASASA